ncbi:DUF3810 family protein [Candidatus Woesearchaeota archaeon]|nr:DUF3810 family protein [Candidatus Woesearchaeota archaeon]
MSEGEGESLETKVQPGAIRPWIGAAGLAGIVAALHGLPSDVIEKYYTHGLCKGIASVTAPIADSTDVHMSEWVVAGLALYGVAKLAVAGKRKVEKACDWLRTDWKLPTKKEIASSAARGSGTLAKFAAGVALVASLGFYLNDRRSPIVPEQVVQKYSFDLAGFRALEQDLRYANAASPRMRRDAQQNALFAAMDNLYQQKYGVRFPAARRVKETVWLLPVIDTNGVAAPPLQEMTVGSNALASDDMMNCGHERGHLFYFSSESEASAFAFEAALASRNPVLRRNALEWLWNLSMSEYHGFILESSLLREDRKAKIFADSMIGYSESLPDRINDLCMRARGHGSRQQAYGKDTLSKCWALYRSGYSGPQVITTCGAR